MCLTLRGLLILLGQTLILAGKGSLHQVALWQPGFRLMLRQMYASS